MKRYNTPHRSRVVKTRMTEEEYAEFAQRLSAYHMSQAEFIRQAITGAAIRPIITVSPVNDELLAAVGKLTAEYGRIGGNLNQIARTLNEWHSPYPQLAGEVRAAVSDLAALMAAALQYLQEHHLTDYAALTASTEAAVDHFHKLSDELRTTEEALSKTSELMAATVDYAKTRPVFDGYKAARYSKKYLAQHEAELATYRAAKDTMNTILNGAKLPKIEILKKSRRELAGQKKELYAEYREAQRQMREAVAVKANIDHLLGITDERENKAQER